MLKGRSKVFLFTTIIEVLLAISFLIVSSMNEILSIDIKGALTIGNLYSYAGIQTTGIILVISAVLNLVGLIYKKKEIITIGTVLIITSLISDFFATTLLINFRGICDEKTVLGCVLCLLFMLINIVIILIGFENQLKLLNKKKSN